MEGTATFKGELTIDELSDTARILCGELMNNDGLIVDTTGVTKVDIASIQLLIAAKKECMANGKSFVVKTSGEVKDLLLFTGLQL